MTPLRKRCPLSVSHSAASSSAAAAAAAGHDAIGVRTAKTSGVIRFEPETRRACSQNQTEIAKKKST